MKKIITTILLGSLMVTNVALALPQSTLSSWAENYKIEQAITDIQNNLQYSNQRDDQNRIDLLNYIAKRFQDSANTLKTGTTIPATVSTCQKISQTLWLGAQDAKDEIPSLGVNTVKVGQVTLLQQALMKVGIIQFAPDSDVAIQKYKLGTYDNLTVDLVKKFQAKYGISQTGAVGPKTLAKINSMICNASAVSNTNIVNKLYPPDQSGFGY